MATVRTMAFLLFTFLLCPVIPSVEAQGAVSDRGVDEEGDSFFLSTKVDNGLLTVVAEEAPLEILFDELSQKIGKELTIHSSTSISIPEIFITASFENRELSDAVAKILQDYSYVLNYEGDEKVDIFIMASKVPGGKSIPKIAASTAGKIYSGTAKIGTIETKKGQKHKHETPVKQKKPEDPTDLDECEKLAFTQRDAVLNTAHLVDDSDDSSASSEGARQVLSENREAVTRSRLKRAKNVLAMEKCKHLWRDAIDELVGIQDEEVTEILADFAVNGKTTPLREHAVSALWNNMADAQFKNTRGITALKQLAASEELAVSRKAQQALKDYEQYTEREKRYSE
jgi:hypothetical protein